MYVLLYHYFSSTLAVISICFSLHDDFILQSQPYILACVAGTLPVPAYKFSSARECAHQYILSRGNHVPSVLRVGEQSERPDVRAGCIIM